MYTFMVHLNHSPNIFIISMQSCAFSLSNLDLRKNVVVVRRTSNWRSILLSLIASPNFRLTKLRRRCGSAYGAKNFIASEISWSMKVRDAGPPSVLYTNRYNNFIFHQSKFLFIYFFRTNLEGIVLLSQLHSLLHR